MDGLQLLCYAATVSLSHRKHPLEDDGEVDNNDEDDHYNTTSASSVDLPFVLLPKDIG